MLIVRGHAFGPAFALVAATLCLGGGSACGGGAGEAESSETGDEFSLEVEVELHESQPMVVDLWVHARGAARQAELTLAHADDAGVRIALLETQADGETRHFRVRGLAPDTLHHVDLQGVLEGEAPIEREIEFTTGAPLLGFVEAMPVEQGGEVDPAYRLLDWSSFGGQGALPAGLAMVDAEGTTRWYIGRSNPELGLGGTLAGVSLLPDGRVLFQHNGQCEIVNELAEREVVISPAGFGDIFYHHDLTMLPNGNVLTIGFEFGTYAYPAPEGEVLLAGDRLSEINPQGEKVWSWSSLEHLDPLRRRHGFDEAPPLIDPSTGLPGKDWTHANALVYVPEDDSLLLSLRHQDLIVKIDHASGEVLWRLGEGGDFELESGEWFFHQHSPQWLPNGDLVLYDNGNGNPHVPEDQWRSRVIIMRLDEVNMSARVVWEDGGTPYFSEAMGDVDRLPNGHLLITDSALGLDQSSALVHARVREVDASGMQALTRWSFKTELGRFVYRAVPTTRLVGEALN